MAITPDEQRLLDRLGNPEHGLSADTIRADGRLDRTCTHWHQHPVGHVYVSSVDIQHDCDGCCADWMTHHAAHITGKWFIKNS